MGTKEQKLAALDESIRESESYSRTWLRFITEDLERSAMGEVEKFLILSAVEKYATHRAQVAGLGIIRAQVEADAFKDS